MLKRSQERVDGDNQNTKQKLTEQIHDYRKEVAKLREVCIYTTLSSPQTVVQLT